MKRLLPILLITTLPINPMDISPNPKVPPKNLTPDERKQSLMNMLSKDKPVVLDVKFHDEKSTGEKTVFYSSACITGVCTMLTGLVSIATLIVSIVALGKDCKK